MNVHSGGLLSFFFPRRVTTMHKPKKRMQDLSVVQPKVHWWSAIAMSEPDSGSDSEDDYQVTEKESTEFTEWCRRMQRVRPPDGGADRTSSPPQSLSLAASGPPRRDSPRIDPCELSKVDLRRIDPSRTTPCEVTPLTASKLKHDGGHADCKRRRTSISRNSLSLNVSW